MKYLLVVEGKKTEPEIFKSILQRYGYTVLVSNRAEKYEDIDLKIDEIAAEQDAVVIVQAPKNRLGELLDYYKRDGVDLNRAFSNMKQIFSGIFLIFDVDHTSNEDLQSMISIHNDETDNGLLLISSPCIEIVSDPNRNKIIDVDHLSEYKAERNIEINTHCESYASSQNARDYISNNFERLAEFFLKKNYETFNEPNVLEHPALVVEKVNLCNVRSAAHVRYQYFTTVIYVVLAVMFRLTKQVDNYKTVLDFFNSKAREFNEPMINVGN